MATANLKAAVLGGQQAGGAGPSPLGNFPEIAKMYAVNPQVAVSSSQNQAGGYQDAVTIANQKAAQQAEQARLAAMADPNKYQQVPKKDGGYSFLDPMGKEISAYDYSRITGKDLGNILQSSQNPIDVGFNNDWKNLQDFMSALVSKDTKTVNAAIKAAPALKQYENDLPGLIKKFQQEYPTVFGYHQAGVPVGQTFIPASSGNLINSSGGIPTRPQGP